MTSFVWSNPTKTEEEVKVKHENVKHCLVMRVRKNLIEFSGGDALKGHTRSHPEHDG